jgi:hypothetical protein
MNKKTLFPITFIVCLGLLSLAPGAQHLTAKNFRITRQCPPWQEVKGSFRTFDTKNLFDLIDGGAPEYVENGLVKGIFQRLSTPDSATLEVFFEDFGTPEHAKKMFTRKRKSAMDACPFSDLDSVALSCSAVIGGYAVCGTLDRFYFEFVLMGTKEPATARDVIVRICDHFRTVTAGGKSVR